MGGRNVERRKAERDKVLHQTLDVEGEFTIPFFTGTHQGLKRKRRKKDKKAKEKSRISNRKKNTPENN